MKETRRRHMVVDSRKPKEWVGITSEHGYKFTIVCMMLLKGLTQLPYSLCLAPILFYLALNTSTTNTTSSTATIPTF
jgi:hypothetical protein